MLSLSGKEYLFAVNRKAIFAGKIRQKEVNKTCVFDSDNIAFYFSSHFIKDFNFILFLQMNGSENIIILRPFDIIHVEKAIFIQLM